jgi:RNA-directed DNA polymerase
MIIERISRETGVGEPYLHQLALTAEYRYKVYTIPKKNGGSRIIQHPARPVKFLQRWLVKNIFSKFPVHSCATAYKAGASIFANATTHVRSNYLLKLDFSNFFESITSEDISLFLNEHGNAAKDLYDVSDIPLISAIVTRKGALTIGAPSSPAIANAIMYKIDKAIYSYCNDHDVRFTRYADDMAFSTNQPHILDSVHRYVTEILCTAVSPKLTLNESKTGFSSRKRRRTVTGLILTPDFKISVGREQKRYIKSLVNKYKIGVIDADSQQYLKGYLSYIKAVEPVFIDALERKYGANVLRRLVNRQLEAELQSHVDVA